MQIGGIASGLDTQSIVKQLMQVESKPLYKLMETQEKYGFKKNLFQGINTSLSSLSKSIESLYKQTTFDQTLGTLSNEDVASIVTDSDSVAGIYNLNVTQLATTTNVTGSWALNEDPDLAAVNKSTATLLSGSVNDLKQTFAANGLTVNSGSIKINGVNIDVDPNDTIEDFMSRVNGSEAGVIMSYVTDGASPDYQKFVITTKDVGSDAEIALTENSTNLFAALNLDTTTVNGSGTIDEDAAIGSAGIKYGGGTSYTETGAISFRINGVAFNFQGDTDSLNDILETVNKSNAGVTAFYDSEADKITFSSKETGAKQIDFEDISGGFLNAVGATSVNQADVNVLGKNAIFTLNGASMERDSNKFDINGITFNLIATGDTTATVEQDTDAIYNSIKEFVDTYNGTIKLLNNRLTEEKVEGAVSDTLRMQGLLRGDSTVMSIRTQLRQAATQQISGLDSKYDLLSEIGISTTSVNFGISGELEIDESKLKEAIQNDPNAVRDLFFKDLDGDEKVDDNETGMAVELFRVVDTYISTATSSVNGVTIKEGILPSRMDSIDRLVDDYNDQIESYEKRLEKVEARYWQKFNAMEQAMQQLNSQASWMSSQLASLG